MSDKHELWEGAGWALIFLGLCLGIGSCSYLVSKGNALETEANAHAKAVVTKKQP